MDFTLKKARSSSVDLIRPIQVLLCQLGISQLWHSRATTVISSKLYKS